MVKEVIIPKDVFESRKTLEYSQAIKAGNTIYLSGSMPCDENFNLVGMGDFVAQTRQSLENMKRTLSAAGATMQDVVKLTWYVKNIGNLEDEQSDWNRASLVRKEYFGEWCPAAMLVEISRLDFPDQLLEIDAIAVVDHD
jgi:2-iminobutanoate/2-iminopropanoate deaminase